MFRLLFLQTLVLEAIWTYNTFLEIQYSPFHLFLCIWIEKAVYPVFLFLQIRNMLYLTSDDKVKSTKQLIEHAFLVLLHGINIFPREYRPLGSIRAVIIFFVNCKFFCYYYL